MPKLLVCYKWVPDEQDVRVNAGDQSLDFSKAKYKISDYDKNAIEAAALLAEQIGAGVDALSFGSAVLKQSTKDVLSRGVDRVCWIGDDAAASADARVTSKVLAAAIGKLGQYDLILCGEGSADSYNQQVAPRVATLLNLPVITFVQELKVENGQVIAVRKVGNCTETVAVALPAVVSVQPEINKPHIPGLKQVMAASKKPAEEIKLADLGLTAADLQAKVVTASVRGYVMNRKNQIFKEAAVADNVAKLVASLAQEGLC